MADPTYDDMILGALIGSPEAERYRRAVHEVQPHHFLVGNHRTLFELLSRYFRMTAYPIDWPQFQLVLANSGVDAARQLTLTNDFQRLWVYDVPEGHFRYALREIRIKRRDERFAAGLADAMRAMYEGIKGELGYAVSRQMLSEALAEIDRNFEEANPEGNIREDAGLVWDEYEQSKVTQGFDARMVRTGLREIDDKIIGLRPGENMLIAGYSSHGKTTIIQNIAWHACVYDAKNVLVFTNENLYGQYRARIYNRHTHLFANGGIRMNEVKTGALGVNDEALFRQAIDDFSTNPGYGKLMVVQMPMGATMEWIANQTGRWQEEFDIGLLVFDYIGRLAATVKRPTRRDELNDALQLWKNLLVSANHGLGLPGVTGYQISREKMTEALNRGYYGLDCLAETSEAERNADIVATALRQDDIERELRMQLPKNRDGALLEPTSMTADFATTLVSSMGGAGGLWG